MRNFVDLFPYFRVGLELALVTDKWHLGHHARLFAFLGGEEVIEHLRIAGEADHRKQFALAVAAFGGPTLRSETRNNRNARTRPGNVVENFKTVGQVLHNFGNLNFAIPLDCPLDPGLLGGLPLFFAKYNRAFFGFDQFFNDTATPELSTLSLHDALPI